jgi:deazaflavin-dependent oxidoreductase (nitroreductase family)
LLIHIGRRTRRRRETVLEILEFRKEAPEMVVMSGFGHNANWLRNIEAASTVEVVVGSKRFSAAHRILDEEEAVRVIIAYERRNWLLAPIVRAVLSRLLGWQYDSSKYAHHKLVAQLPLIAFRPLSSHNC